MAPQAEAEGQAKGRGTGGAAAGRGKAGQKLKAIAVACLEWSGEEDEAPGDTDKRGNLKEAVGGRDGAETQKSVYQRDGGSQPLHGVHTGRPLGTTLGEIPLRWLERYFGGEEWSVYGAPRSKWG